MTSASLEQTVTAVIRQNDENICHQCQKIDIHQLLEASSQDQVGNDDSGTWRVKYLDAEHIKVSAPSCSLCRSWAKAIIEAPSASHGTVANPASSIHHRNSWELRAFDPENADRTCWDFQFDRRGALRGLMPRRVLFVCRSGSRPYELQSVATPKRRRVGTLLALFDEEAWKEWSTRSACTFDSSLGDLKKWWGRETSELRPYSKSLRDLYMSRTRGMVSKRLIDCETSTIVSAQTGMQYMALSYCWSLAQQDLVDRENVPSKITDSSRRNSTGAFTSNPSALHGTETGSIGASSWVWDSLDEVPVPLPSKIPRVIRDAVQITRRLGHKYLWVDKYCINQDDKDELTSQIHQMDLIYESAHTTLIVANTDGRMDGPRQEARAVTSLPGCALLEVPEPCLDEMDEAPWSSRAWTFQEDVAATRALFFTENGLFYRGSEFIWDGRWSTRAGSEKYLSYPWTLRGRLGHEMPSLWLEVKRDLTDWRRKVRASDLPSNRSAGTYIEFCWVITRTWNRLASEFTRRNLPVPGDVRHGFFGLNETISEAVREIWGTTFGTLEGIPFCRLALKRGGGGDNWGPIIFKDDNKAGQDGTGSADVGLMDDMKRNVEKFEEVRLKCFLLSLLWISKDPAHSILRMPGQYWTGPGYEWGHYFRTWSWVGWIGHVVWLYDVLPDGPFGDGFHTCCKIAIAFPEYNSDSFVSFEKADRGSKFNVKSLHHGILRLFSHRVDYKSLGLDELDGWRTEFWSINSDPPLENWEKCKEVRREQDIWEGIYRQKLACLVVGEQRKQESVRLFCLVVYPASLVQERRWWHPGRQGWYRRGVIVLKKRISAGESAESQQMPFIDREEAPEAFDLF